MCGNFIKNYIFRCLFMHQVDNIGITKKIHSIPYICCLKMDKIDYDFNSEHAIFHDFNSVYG